MNILKQQTCCLLARAAVLLAPLAAHGATTAVTGTGAPGPAALEANTVPEPGSVLMLAVGLVVARCMRRRGHGLEFEE